MNIPTEITFKTVMPTRDQEAALDHAAAHEIECEKTWQAARNAKPFNKTEEAQAWENYQAAMRATSQAARS
jgi:hypothetical protein